MFFFFNGTATTEISTYGHPLSRPHALPISRRWPARERPRRALPSSCASVPPGVSPRLLKRARPPSPRWRLSRSKRRNPRSPGHSAHPIRRDGRDSTSPNRNWGWLWVRWADNHPQNGRRSEEHTSELQSLMRISYAVFCLQKKKNTKQQNDSKT